MVCLDLKKKGNRAALPLLLHSMAVFPIGWINPSFYPSACHMFAYEFERQHLLVTRNVKDESNVACA